MDAAPHAFLAHWGLRQDGDSWQGWTSRVWPVRGPRGQSWVIKVPNDDQSPSAEAAALRAWGGSDAARHRVVSLVDEHEGVLVLQRLDADICLADSPIAEADQVIAESIVALAGVSPPAHVPDLTDDLDRLRVSIESACSDHPELLPRHIVERALDSLNELAAHVSASARTLVHYDLPYLNVLRDPRTDRWVVIDPLPRAGVPEVEVVAALRNRWADLVETGDAERAMRRRFDLLTGTAGLDRERAAAFAQAVAVDNLMWLLPREPQHMFVPPYSMLSRW